MLRKHEKSVTVGVFLIC